ncbi:MAG: hypothetical protein FJX76_00775 [Armatimonadetes bacterium]|nr:hypothetical protein [Armatimonadota bacterium]
MRAPRLDGLIFGINAKDQAVFFRQLATMIDAGMPTAKALATLRPQLSGRLGALVGELLEYCDQGHPLSDGIARYPEYFSPFVVAMLRAGEVGGAIDRRLIEVADFLESSYAIQQNIASQLIYPAVIIHAGIVLPPLFVLVTQGMAPYLRIVLPALLVMWTVVIGLYCTARMGAVRPGARALLDRLLLSLPLFSKVVRGAACMRFLQAFGDLLDAGVPSPTAVEVAGRACGNVVLGNRLSATSRMMADGMSVTAALTSSGVLPPATLGMIATGEESGSIGHLMRKASEYLQIEHRESLKRMMTVFPVILMLIIGVIVGIGYIRAFAGLFSQINSIVP